MIDPKKPSRAFVLELRAEGDTREALVALLKQMTADIARGQSQSVTGGYDCGGHYQFTLTPDKTHDAYVKELEAYLAATASGK